MPSDQPSMSNVSNDEISKAVRDYRRQRRVCDIENAVSRHMLKGYERDGLNPKAVVAAYRAARHDPEEVVNGLRDVIHYMSVSRIPITADAVFGSWTPSVTEKSRMDDDIAKAEDLGYKAGRFEMDRKECPYERGTELEVAWLKWHRLGQEAIARELGDNARQASASRQRPVRAAEQAPIPDTEPDEQASIPDTEPDAPAPDFATEPGAPRKRRSKANGEQPPRRRRAAGDARAA